MSTLAVNKHISILFFHHRPRFPQLSTENISDYSVGNGYQSAYSRADTTVVTLNDRSKRFSITAKIWEKSVDDIINKLEDQYFLLKEYM